jgi:MFS family permease
MALVKFGVARTLSFLMFGFGISTLAQGHTQSWPVLAVCRVLVGVFEASTFPATVVLISAWYVRYQAHQKLALMYSVGLIASSFAGVLAYGLGKMEGIGGLRGWRWIFTVCPATKSFNNHSPNDRWKGLLQFCVPCRPCSSRSTSQIELNS